MILLYLRFETYMPRKMLKIHESTSILEPEWNQRQIKTLGTRINTDFQRQNRLFELQTDSTGYKQKSLILRHFQKRLDPINHYKKEK